MLIFLEEKWLQMLGLLPWVSIFSETLTQKSLLLYYFCCLEDNSLDMPKFIFEHPDCVFTGSDAQNYLHCHYQEKISTTFLFLNSLKLAIQQWYMRGGKTFFSVLIFHWYIIQWNYYLRARRLIQHTFIILPLFVTSLEMSFSKIDFDRFKK